MLLRSSNAFAEMNTGVILCDLPLTHLLLVKHPRYLLSLRALRGYR